MKLSDLGIRHDFATDRQMDGQVDGQVAGENYMSLKSKDRNTIGQSFFMSTSQCDCVKIMCSLDSKCFDWGNISVKA